MVLPAAHRPPAEPKRKPAVIAACFTSPRPARSQARQRPCDLRRGQDLRFQVHQQALEEQLRQQAVQQRKAEQTAREAKESRGFWIAVLGVGGCVSSLLVLLLGVYIGSSAIRYYRKDFHGPHPIIRQ